MRNYFISGHHYIQDVVLDAGTYTFWAYIKSDFGNTFTFALANAANEWEVFDVDVQQGQYNISRIYVGSDRIQEVYYGSEKVWEDSRGYWVHKDTGVKTYFTYRDVNIGDGIMGRPSWYRDCSEVKVPHRLIGLDASCFGGCTSLTSIILPKGFSSIGMSCFDGCTSLTSINLPESIISIESYCFRDCSSLTAITLPESIISIGRGCFRRCTALTSITIPENITKLESYCFDRCTSLTLATVLPATPPSLSSTTFSNVHSSFNIKVRSPYVNVYKTATGWSTYASKISAI